MAASDSTYHPAFAFPGVLSALSLLVGHAICASLAVADWKLGAVALAGGLIVMITSERRSRTFAVAFCALFAGVGAAQQSLVVARDHAAFTQIESLTQFPSRKIELRGRIAITPQRSTSGWLIYVDEDTTLRGTEAPVRAGGLIAVRVLADSGAPDPFTTPPVIGDLLEATGELRELARSTTSGDPGSWMRARGAVAQVFAAKKETPSVTASQLPWPRFLRLCAVASSECESIIRGALPPQQAALLTALTIGKTHLLSDEQRAAFRRTGLLHLFSVSGLHTMLVGGMLVMLLRFFGLRPVPRFILLIVALMFFAALVGMTSPVIRAALLLLLNEARQMLRRPIEPLAALGSIATILLIVSPRLPWQLDFQMTFLCAIALVLMSQWTVALKIAVGRRLGWSWKSKVVTNLLQVVIASTVIQTILLPVFANQFGEVSLIAPIANALLLEIASFVLVVGFAVLLLCLPLPFVGSHLMAWLKWPLWLLGWGTDELSRLPFATVQLHTWPLSLTALLYVAIAASAFARFHGQRHPRRSAWQFIPAGLLVAAMLAAQSLVDRGDGKLHIWFLDVGQGDATLLQFPDRTAALVDAGPQSMAWALPGMIKRRGIDRLSFVVATHADSDHIGGMNEVLDAIPTDALLVGGSLAATGQFIDLEQAVRKNYIPVVTTLRGGEWENSEGKVHFLTLHPTPEFSRDPSSINNASVVLRVDYAGHSILLTGDAARDAEVSMIDSGLPITADILKVGHHGSASSSTDAFLDAVNPIIGIISCGKNNQYHHPSPKTMERLQERGVTVYRTDNDGTIELTIDQFGEVAIEGTKQEESVLQ
ncbi:MAG: DNA internalization-related competence protein ComEC/Rec2 [Candidatus Sumerlaeota bacterium]